MRPGQIGRAFRSASPDRRLPRSVVPISGRGPLPPGGFHGVERPGGPFLPAGYPCKGAVEAQKKTRMKWALVWGEIGRHAAPGTTGIAGKAAYPGPHGPNGRVPDSLDEAKRGALGEAYPVDSGLSRCSMLSDRIGAVARADTDGEGAVARGIPEVVSR